MSRGPPPVSRPSCQNLIRRCERFLFLRTQRASGGSVESVMRSGGFFAARFPAMFQLCDRTERLSARRSLVKAFDSTCIPPSRDLDTDEAIGSPQTTPIPRSSLLSHALSLAPPLPHPRLKFFSSRVRGSSPFRAQQACDQPLQLKSNLFYRCRKATDRGRRLMETTPTVPGQKGFGERYRIRTVFAPSPPKVSFETQTSKPNRT